MHYDFSLETSTVDIVVPVCPQICSFHDYLLHIEHIKNHLIHFHLLIINNRLIQVYEGAVYMHQGKTYLVKDLDTKGKIALCQRANMEYYTKTRDYTDIHVVGGNIVCQALLYLNYVWLSFLWLT